MDARAQWFLSHTGHSIAGGVPLPSLWEFNAMKTLLWFHCYSGFRGYAMQAQKRFGCIIVCLMQHS